MKRISLIVAVGLALLAQPMRAQERMGSGAPDQLYRAGWTLTPTIGVAETYDTNVSLFSQGHAGNEDYIATVFPAADLHYTGKHSMLDMAYSGSFLDYRRFSELNRWDQRAKFEMRRQETARFAWFAHATGALLPTTDLIDLGGIPYRKTGATTADGRGGIEYALDARNSLTHSLNYQMVSFDRPADAADILRGGRIFESANAWRRKMNARLAVGADYSYRRAVVTGDREAFNFHTTEAAMDYELSSLWSLRAGAGAVYLQQTSVTEARTGPAFRASLERHRAGTTFHVGYLRTFIPSFGFGGTVESQDVGVGFRTPLFHARHVYVDSSAVFRDNQPLTGVISDPLTGVVEQLPLRSFRMHTILGWEPQPWMRLEGFYSLVQQTSLRVGGYLDRNRVGFQVVTSKPMRMQ
jgi:hypothetical protein